MVYVSSFVILFNKSNIDKTSVFNTVVSSGVSVPFSVISLTSFGSNFIPSLLNDFK